MTDKVIYRFQRKYGYIAAGFDEVEIKNFLGVVSKPISPSMLQLIEAHGGVLVEDKPKPKSKARKKTGAKDDG